MSGQGEGLQDVLTEAQRKVNSHTDRRDHQPIKPLQDRMQELTFQIYKQHSQNDVSPQSVHHPALSNSQN